MGWEKRGHKTYYYTAEKVNGRTVKTYHSDQFGTAAVLDKINTLDRQRGELDRMIKRDQMAEWDALEGHVKAISRFALAVVTDTLTAAGYHQHKRGEWRKKRMATKASGAELKAAPKWEVPATREERIRLVRDVMCQTKPTMQETAGALLCLRKHPNEVKWNTGNSVKAVLYMAAPSDVHFEVMEQETEIKRRELTGPNPSPLESLLIDRILACWLTVNYFEQQQAIKSKPGVSMTLEVSDHLQKRVDRAHNRYLAAIKTLAQVRRLQVPVNVQVNVAAAGGQQVNVGTLQTGESGLPSPLFGTE